MTALPRDSETRRALGVPRDQDLHLLVDGIPGVVWMATGHPDTPDQRIEYISSYVEKMLGYSTEEWLATPNFWLTVVHPDDRERAATTAAEAFAAGRSHINEFRWMTKDGRTLWVEAHSTVITDATGRPVGMRGVTLDITARKLAEEEARQSQRLINETPFLLTRCSRDLRYVFVSQAYARVLGRTREEIQGQRIVDVVGEASFATAWPYMERVLAGERVEFENFIGVDGGEPRAYHVVYTPDIGPGGRVDGWMASIADVSDPGSTSGARALLASIVESSSDAIITKDLQGLITSWNAAAERLFGYTAEELLGRPVRLLIPPANQHEEDDILARIARGERIEHFETVRVAKDGRELNISLTISPLRDATGRIFGASKIARDVTEARLAEAERLRLIEENATITESINRVGAIIASDLDRDKVVQQVTDVATELTTAEFGAFFYNVTNEAGESYTLYTISGVPSDAFSTFPMPRNTEVFAPTFSGTATVRSADITKDPRYGHNPPHQGMPEGHLPVRSYLAVPVRGPGGVLGGLFFGHSQPGRFSEHHERLAEGVASWAAVALENARLFATVQAASQLKDEFLASLSHELRTPLNAIFGYARLLRAGVVTAEKHARAIETIERNATSLAKIVEDVLDISRIVSGKIRLNVQAVDFPQIVRNAIDAVSVAADAKGVRIDAVLDPEAGPISGDPERLQQVLWNVLANAVKFTGREGKVQVRLERVHSHVEATVADTGIGISPEFLPHVFERFRQADAGTTRERGGLGLGLSIARQLVEMHGGTIEAASPGVGKGTTVRVKLPLLIAHPRRDAADAARLRTTPNQESVATGDLFGVHVLAVDDDPDAVSLVAELLATAGARVSVAGSAEAAMRIIDAEVPQVLVSDLGMPRVDGFELIAQVRAHKNPMVRRMPAAALTAYARSEDRVKALRAGFQIHLAKPVDPRELVTTVAALASRFTPGGP